MASKGVELCRALGQSSLAEKSVLGSLFPSSSGVSVSKKREAHFIHWLTVRLYLSKRRKRLLTSSMSGHSLEKFYISIEEQFLGKKYTRSCNIKSVSGH